MSSQNYDSQQEEEGSSEDEYDYNREPEPDPSTLRSNEQRSRYFMAAMSFLLALLCLSAYLNHLASINGELLQLGMIGFGAIGLFFLLRGRIAYPHSYTPRPARDQRGAFKEEIIDDEQTAYDEQVDDKNHIV